METVSPTFAESFHYANLSGQVFWTVIGVVLIAAAAALLVLTAKNIISGSIGTNIIVFVLVAGGFCSILGKPGAIYLSNNKKVSTEYLQQVGRTYILDSCYNNNLMINAAKK